MGVSSTQFYLIESFPFSIRFIHKSMEGEDRAMRDEFGKMPGENEISSNLKKSRLVIEKLVLENFKSYAGVKVNVLMFEFYN